MTRTLIHILLRDLAMLVPGGRGNAAGGGQLLPLLFFIAVAMLFPFAVGPDAKVLARTGGGVIWIAALLAAILPVERLVAPDLDQGFFDQWSLRGLSEEAVILIKMLAHWIGFGPPLMLAALPASALLRIDSATLGKVLWGLLAGTPGLAAIGIMIAALTASLRSGAALAGLLVIPLAVPLLVFGAGSLAPGGESGLGLCAAISLALVAIAPFASGAAVRAARN